MPETMLRRRPLLAALAALAPLPWLGARSARAANPPNEAITAVTLIHGIAGGERDLAAHLLSLSTLTRAEPGCLLYDLYQSPDQPAEFMRLERWRSLADLEAHKASPYLRASFEKRAREGWTTQITVWKRVSDDA